MIAAMNNQIACRQVNLTETRVFMGTLTDGISIHAGLKDVAHTNKIHTATFDLLGGLHSVALTAYDFERQERLEPLILKRPLEIIAGHGTISLLEGEPHIHLHLALSYREGDQIRVVGGHAATAIAFAVEFTLTAYGGAPVKRGLHAKTGLMLWNLADGQ